MVDIRCVRGRKFFMRNQLLDEVADVLVGILQCKELKLTKPLCEVSVESVAQKLCEFLSRRSVFFKSVR
jgi:hypothetical protein